MSFLQLTPDDWINLNHITRIWVKNDKVHFQLSSDVWDSFHVLDSERTLNAFCHATGFPNPSTL